MADFVFEISQGESSMTFECLQQLVCRNSCCAECIWRIASGGRKPSFLAALAGIPPRPLRCTPPLLPSPPSFTLSSSPVPFVSPSPPTHCSEMSAGALIGQIDSKWSRGVWANQSNVVKQFFGRGGISPACVELIRSHSAQWPAGLLGPRATASPAPWRTTHAPLSMLHCL